jgi:hypothetical protein
MKSYLVPRAVRARFEFSPGFGLPELLAVVAGGVLGLSLQWLWALCGIPGPAGFGGRVFLFAVPICAGYMLLHQDATGSSLFGQARAALGWMRRPRVYLYRHRGWAPWCRC